MAIGIKQPIFEFMASHPEEATNFDAGMTAIHGPETAAMLEAELLAHCRGRLARFKLPRAVDLVAALPKGGRMLRWCHRCSMVRAARAGTMGARLEGRA